MNAQHNCRFRCPLMWCIVMLTLLLTTGCKSRHNNNKPDHDKSPAANVAEDNWATLDISLTGNDNAALYAEVRSWLGTPYRYGDDKKHKGTDCSGFVGQVFRSVYGIALQRNSAKMFAKDCHPVKKTDLREADLVFFNNGGKRITHVGIYLRDGKFVHASSSRGVTVSDLGQRYYVKHYQCAGRVPDVEKRKQTISPADKRSVKRTKRR